MLPADQALQCRAGPVLSELPLQGFDVLLHLRTSGFHSSDGDEYVRALQSEIGGWVAWGIPLTRALGHEPDEPRSFGCIQHGRSVRGRSTGSP